MYVLPSHLCQFAILQHHLLMDGYNLYKSERTKYPEDTFYDFLEPETLPLEVPSSTEKKKYICLRRQPAAFFMLSWEYIAKIFTNAAFQTVWMHWQFRLTIKPLVSRKSQAPVVASIPPTATWVEDSNRETSLEDMNYDDIEAKMQVNRSWITALRCLPEDLDSFNSQCAELKDEWLKSLYCELRRVTCINHTMYNKWIFPM